MLEPNQMLEFAPTAFIGTVTAVPAGWWVEEVDRPCYTFEVETVLAGDVPAIVDVTTADNSAACGFEAADRNPDGSVRSRRGQRCTALRACARRPMPIWRSRRLGLEPAQPEAARFPLRRGSGFDWQAVWLGAGGLAVVAGVWLAGRRRA